MSKSLEPIAVATQQGGAEITENGICPTITAAAGMSGNNQPWICKPTDEVAQEKTYIIDSIGGQAERGWESDIAPCLKASHYKFPPCITVAAGFKPSQGAKAMGIGWEEEIAPTLLAGQEPAVCIKVWDARGNGDGETVSTITGDHENRITDYTSIVVEPVAYNGENITSPLNKTNPQPGDPCHTIGTDSRNYLVIPIHDQATRFSGKRGDKSDGKGNGLGIGNPGDAANTLTAGDRHAVAYAMQGFGDYKDCGVTSGLKARDYKDATDLVVESYGVDCRNMNEYQELYPTLQAKPNGGQSLNFSGAVRTTIPEEKGASEPMVRYIVRRLTPTECARLQGFPDKWGHPDKKEDFTEEEYQFWLNVRNTHAAINGKAEKEYTKEQMLTWYNKLHTDSSEYKMWGNGIALPCALYVMQGIAEALAK